MTPSLQPLSRKGERGFFGDAAVRLCGAAATVLGWRPAEFWNATPAELASALTPMATEVEGPDMSTLDALRRQFPDE